MAELYKPVPPEMVLCCENQPDSRMVKVRTAYGARLTCPTHRRVWTRIKANAGFGEPWVEEKYAGFGVFAEAEIRPGIVLSSAELRIKHANGMDTVLDGDGIRLEMRE